MKLNFSKAEAADESPFDLARREIDCARRLAQIEPLSFEIIDALDRALCAALKFISEAETNKDNYS